MTDAQKAVNPHTHAIDVLPPGIPMLIQMICRQIISQKLPCLHFTGILRVYIITECYEISADAAHAVTGHGGNKQLISRQCQGVVNKATASR